MLVLEKVEKSYESHTVLKGISSTFHYGQCYLLLGDNGAGKSTLLKCIAGDEKIDRGSIRVQQQDDVANLTALQYQFFESYSFLKVKEVIRLFAQLIEKPSNVEELYDILDIVQYENTLIKNASGGQRKALSLYLAFLINKPIVLLDEPFADLDLKKKKQLLGFLQNQVRQENKCLLIISHEIVGLEDLFDYVYIMKDGQFIEHGLAADLVRKYHNPTFPGLEGVYFEVTGQLFGGRFK
ncbi:ATP-binding cassette domain-containing protein [Solibacillus silvestris]|uniref:ATP-binding cassette domain-containing protein n=1 Tax=Solibacillus silvestris TaxID=76853 RepID=UPI003F80D765